MKRLFALIFALAVTASAQVPQVPIFGPIGSSGAGFPTINSPAVVFPSDADYTATYPAMSGSSGVIKVTSTGTLTASRKLIMPLVRGFQFTIINDTTGGQSIPVGGASGASTAPIPNCSVSASTCGALVATDGVNYVQVGSTTGAGVGTSVNLLTMYGQTQADSILATPLNGYVSFGDSLAVAVGASTPYPTIVATDIGTNLNNQAVSGDNAGDQSWHIFTTINPTDGGNPIVTSDIGTNDYSFGSSVLIFSKYQYANATWAAISSTNKILATNGAITPTGSPSTDTTWANAHGLTFSASGTIPYTTCEVGPSGVVYVWYKMTGTSGTFTVSIDGTPAVDTVGGASTVNTNWTGDAAIHQSAAVGAARFVTTQGQHTCTATWVSGTTTILGFGFPPVTRYRGISAPRYVMGNIIPQQNNTAATTIAPYNAADAAIQATLVGDGLNVPLVDLQHALDYNLDFNGGQNCTASTVLPAHPGQCGYQHMAQAFESIIGAVPGGGASSSFLGDPIGTSWPSAGIYAGVAGNGSGSIVYSNPQAPTDAKHWQIYADTQGDLITAAPNDAVTSATIASTISRSGANLPDQRTWIPADFTGSMTSGVPVSFPAVWLGTAGNYPVKNMINSFAPSGARVEQEYLDSSGTLYHFFVNDAFTSSNYYSAVTQTAGVPTSYQIVPPANLLQGLKINSSQTLTSLQGSTGTKIFTAWSGGFTAGNIVTTDSNGTAIDSGTTGVTSIIPGTNVTCTPNVSGSCVGAVTLNASGSGSTAIDYYANSAPAGCGNLAANTSCATTIPLPGAMPDTSYFVSCMAVYDNTVSSPYALEVIAKAPGTIPTASGGAYPIAVQNIGTGQYNGTGTGTASPVFQCHFHHN